MNSIALRYSVLIEIEIQFCVLHRVLSLLLLLFLDLRGFLYFLPDAHYLRTTVSRTFLTTFQPLIRLHTSNGSPLHHESIDSLKLLQI